MRGPETLTETQTAGRLPAALQNWGLWENVAPNPSLETPPGDLVTHRSGNLLLSAS